MAVIRQLMIMVASAIAIFAFISLSTLFLIWWERKVSARIQSRIGPMRVGWHGLLQTIADAVKLLLKENIVPTHADRWVHWAAPVVVFVAAFSAYLVIPFGDGLIAKDLNLGILYILAITSLGVLGIVMAGWGSNNKYSLLGAMRSAAQVVSYEVPLVLSILGVVMMVGSLSMVQIVEAQSRIWFICLQPIAFFTYLVSALAETNRAPFDIPEAESELVAGFHTEYSGMKFGIFFLAEYANMFTVAAVATTLFLGGWGGPFLPPPLWFLIKVYAIIFTMMWFRWTFPRFRVDQLMGFAWKVLLPLTLANLCITGIVILAISP